ncbi:MAG: T9SS type A sorting domain-containing protein, partial [Ignavibacteriales bacterium]|nr:T9SS type A sorting domain-containing protein [Ignavibacteriales bacterium]
DGNLYLQWTRPSEQIVGYEIWRWDEAGDSSLVATIISSLDTLKWVDRYDYNELNGIPGDTLFVFQYYTYGVKAINFFDIPSEFSNFDSDYCNRAPENVRGKIINENQVMWEVSWDPIRTHLNKGEFNYTAICYYHPLQVEKNIHQTLIVDTTVANFKVDTDKTYYCEVYAVELVSGRNDSTQKSLPMFCDFREPPFPHLKMHELELQPQPYHAGIFVCWEKYWKNNFVNGYDSSLVDLFQLTRYGMTGTAKKDTLVLDFSEDSKEWKKAQFMDDSLLISDMTYRYRIDPCIITVDGDTIKPRDYVEKSTKHDTSRVFIPKIDTIYVKGKSNPKLFFNGNKNKVSVSWYYLEQDGITKAQTSRGAATVKIQLSTNREFDQLNHPNSIATIIIPAYQNNKMFTSVDFTNIDTLNHYTNAPYFIQITAFDKWGNQHGYTTRYEDGDFKIYDDSTPPTKSNFRSIISRADTSSEVGKIQLALKWDESAEDPATESGIKWYHLNFYDINSNKQKGAWKIHNADTTLILGFPDLKNENLLNYGRYFKLIPEDRVGNIAEPDSEAWYPIPFPLYFVVKKIPNRRFTYKFEWHPSIYLEGYNIDSYYLEWHDNKYSLGDFIIRKPEFCVIIPGDKDTLRKAYNDFPGKYFHIHARIKGVNNQLQESGWSNTDSTDRQYLEKNMTMQNNDTELIVPSSFSLKQNYPNPFNNNTKIEYWVPNSNEVSIKIYNIVGKEIITLVDGKISAGIYQMYWNGKDKFNQLLPSGIYFITMKAENYHKIIKCMLLK